MVVGTPGVAFAQGRNLDPDVETRDAATSPAPVVFRDDIDTVPPPPIRVANRTIVQQYQVMRRITRRTLEVTNRSITVEIRFQPLLSTRFPARLDYRFWAVAPSGKNLTGTVLEADWNVVEEDYDITNGPFSLKPDPVWGELTPGLKQVRSEEVDMVRGVPLHRVEVNLVQSIANVKSQGQAVAWISRMVVRLDFPEPVPDDASAFNDPYALGLLSNEVVNAEHIARVYTPSVAPKEEAETRAWNDRLAAAEANGLLVKGKLPRGGVYTLSSAELDAIGVDTDALDTKYLRAFIGNREVPIYLDRFGRDRFTTDGRIAFYAPVDEKDRKPYQAFWLMLDKSGDAPLRSTGLVQRYPFDRKLEGRTRVTIFEPRVFNHKMPLDAPQLKWASAQLSPGDFESFEFQSGEVRPEEAVQGKLWLTMLATGASTGDAVMAVYINGEEVHRETSRGTRVIEAGFSFPASLLRAGTNRFAVRSLAPPAGNHGVVQFVQASLDLPVLSDQIRPQALFTATSDVESTNNLTFAAPGSESRAALLVDATEPNAPAYVRMEGVPQSNRVVWTATAPVPGEGRRYLFSPLDTAFRVRDLQVTAAPRSFRDNAQLDYLIVAHSTLAEALGPLVEKRREKFTTEIYTVEDIYDAFSAGEVSYQAIHRAIEHAFRTRQAPPIQAVLLVGEGSEYWWEYRRPSAGIAQNLLPVFGWQDQADSMRGDDSYTLLTGRGHISDVEMGRLSTEDPKELSAMIEKMLRYETQPPPGDWRYRHLFVADDEPEFGEVCTEIVTKSFAGANLPVYLFLQDFPYEDYFRGFWRKRSTTMTEELIRQWADGALTITYLGHGGPNLWSSERILHNRDVETIADGGRHPFLVAGSCDTGWVDYPIEPVRASLSEQLTRNPVGGAIAAFIPIDGTSSFEHNFLLTSFYEAMLLRGQRRFGTISLLAKMNYYLPRNNSRVTNQYLMMGDPLMELPEQKGEIVLKASPLEFLKLSRGEISVEGQFPGVPWGVVDVVLLNPDQQVASREKMRLVNSYFSGKIQLPADFTPGTYRLMAIAVSDSAGQQGSASLPVEVHDHNIRFAWKTDVATDKPLPAGTPLNVTMEVTNDSRLRLEGASLVIEDFLGKEFFRAEVAAAPGDTLRQTFNTPVPPGVTTITGKLFLKGETIRPVAKASLMLSGTTEDRRPLDVILGETRVEYLRDDAGMQFIVPVISMTSEPVTRKILRLVGSDIETSVTLGDKNIAQLAPFARRDYLYRTDRILPSGVQRLRLDLLDADSKEVVFQLPFEFDLGRGADLEIVPESVVVENMNPRAGNTVFLRFDVRNSGDRPSYGVRTHLFVDRPWIDANIATNSVPWGYSRDIRMILPGETRSLRQRWDPSGGSASETTLHLGVKSLEGEANMLNNTLEVPIKLLAATNLKLGVESAVVSHKAVQPYDRVRFSMPILNDSDRDFLQEFRVTVNAIRISGEPRRLISARFKPLAAKSQAALQFDWLCQPGEYAVEVSVNADREYLEKDYSDNDHRFVFPYVFPASVLAKGGQPIDFTPYFRFGALRDIKLNPAGGAVIADRPQGATEIRVFKPEYIVAGQFQYSGGSDGMAEIFKGTDLRTSLNEETEPVKFRIPMNPDDGTTIYDVNIVLMARTPREAEPTGIFRYRFEEAEDWKIEDRTRPAAGKYGVIDTMDDFLVFEFATTEAMARNQLMRFELHPQTGEISSPLLRLRDSLTARLEAEVSTPGDARVDFFVRYGSGQNEEIVWQEWQPTEIGGLLQSPPGANYLQWRARLVAAQPERPSLDSLRLVPVRASSKVTMQQELP